MLARGLDRAEAEARLRTHGPNALPETPPPSTLTRVLRQLANPLVYLLLFALGLDVVLWIVQGHGSPIEAIAIGAVLALNAGLGAMQEHKSEQALAQLRAMAAPHVWVFRDGQLVHVTGRELVPGDVVRLEAGERVPADGRVLEAQGLAIDESVLTGESIAVDKSAAHEVSSGTLAVRGKGLFEVTNTGPRSTMGRLAAMLGTIEAEATPLEKRLDRFGGQIARLVGALSLALAIAGVAAEGFSRVGEVVLFAVALAVAAVPEGMPAVVTLTLALGVQRMARRNAVVRRLAAVEALGSVTVIATDKTGTLTENRMRVHALEAVEGAKHEALAAMVLANDADHTLEAGQEQVGDPLEIGLLLHAQSEGVDLGSMREAHPRIAGRPFDSEWKFQRTSVAHDEGPRSYFKGAPEVLLSRCDDDGTLARWKERAEEAAREGYRVLALASSEGEREDALTLLGLVLLWDPPRAEVPQAIRTAQSAGVRVVMITGDHPGTAQSIAKTIGIAGAERGAATGAQLEGKTDAELAALVKEHSVFARVSPEHKLALVRALQSRGEIVAMTGDGVNDAPALKRSDVGVAMGLRGSDVAREVSDLVLLDDNFATIVSAIEEGRAIYENILSFIRFTFSTNVALVLLIVVGAAGSYALDLRTADGSLLLPLTALQMLWINFLGDGPPALALALDRAPDVMSRPPRPADSALLDVASLRFILAAGAVRGLFSLALLALFPQWGFPILVVQSVIFLHEATTKLLTAYPARRLVRPPLPNPALHGSLAVGLGLQVLVIVLEPLRTTLEVETLDATSVGALVLAVLVTWLLIEIATVFARRSALGR
ncbi:MAG: cation-transporting P-type ATPase [Sandaracinaceae bacterium]|nr:cation-transporting P-type ATPase [Sandaracinaceae bacterium]